jgi:hypothetical protein
MDCTSVAEAVLQRVVFQFGVPKRIVSDQGKSFDNKVFSYLMKCLNIEGTLVSPENHGSLVAERSIQSLSKLLLSQLEGHGRQWPMYIQAICYSYNTFSHSLLGGYSPFEMVYGRPPPDHTNINIVPSDEVPTNYESYIQRLKSKLQTIGATVIKLHNAGQERQALKRSSVLRKKVCYKAGQLVYFLMPSHSNLQTNTRKFTVSYIGPVRIKELLDSTHVILEDLSGRLISGIHHIRRIKPAHLRHEEELEADLRVNALSEVQCEDDVRSSDVPHCSPREGEELTLSKSRFRHGEQQVLFTSQDGRWFEWYTLQDHPKLSKCLEGVWFPRVVGSHERWVADYLT